MTPLPKALVFDLGGVIVDFAGLADLPRLLPDPLTEDEVRARWISCKSVSAFERGELSNDAFAQSFLAEWRLQMTPEAFLALFRAWLKAPYEGVADILAALRPRFILACLSNTNALHWRDMHERYDLPALFEHRYASHLLRRMKPDPEVFAFIAKDLGFDPGEIVFFDDGIENVEGARAVGMAAHQVRGVAELKATLVELNLL